MRNARRRPWWQRVLRAGARLRQRWQQTLARLLGPSEGELLGLDDDHLFW